MNFTFETNSTGRYEGKIRAVISFASGPLGVVYTSWCKDKDEAKRVADEYLQAIGEYNLDSDSTQAVLDRLYELAINVSEAVIGYSAICSSNKAEFHVPALARNIWSQVVSYCIPVILRDAILEAGSEKRISLCMNINAWRRKTGEGAIGIAIGVENFDVVEEIMSVLSAVILSSDVFKKPVSIRMDEREVILFR